MTNDLEGGGYTRHKGCDHIFFIGFLGAGKSTVARNLGRLFNRRHLDTDRMVVHREHASVAELFATVGEERFRDYERVALTQLKREKSCLVSCGGGIVKRGENLRALHQNGVVLFIDRPLDALTVGGGRPLSSSPEALRQMEAERRPLYLAAADAVIPNSGTVEDAVAAAMEALDEIFSH